MHKLKAITVFTCCILSFSISGCVTQKEYDDLEKRLTAVEERLNISNENPIAIEDSSISNGEINQNDVESAASDEYIYVIDDMSVDEIVEECFYYFNNLPSEGQSFDEYEKTLKVQPPKSYGNGRYVFNEIDRAKAPEKDIIESVSVEITSNLDGSIHIDRNYVYVNVELWIKDYDKAVAVYESLKTKLEPFYYSTIENKGSSEWKLSGYYDPINGDGSAGGMGVNEIVAIYKKDDCFNISTAKITNVLE